MGIWGPGCEAYSVSVHCMSVGGNWDRSWWSGVGEVRGWWFVARMSTARGGGRRSSGRVQV